MSFLEGGGQITRRKYEGCLGERIETNLLEAEKVYFAMLAMEQNNAEIEATQHPCKVKSKPAESINGLYVVKFCFLGQDLGEEPTFDLDLHENGLLAHPGKMIINGVIRAREGYLRQYADDSDNWLRSLKNELTLTGT